MSKKPILGNRITAEPLELEESDVEEVVTKLNEERGQ